MQTILVSMLDQAVVFARERIAALPDDVSIADECDAINAVSASANSLAELILAGPRDPVAHAKAEAWLDGCPSRLMQIWP